MKPFLSGLMFIIPGTWEVEIRKTAFRGQPRQKSYQVPMSAKDMVMQFYSLSHLGSCRWGGSLSKASWKKPKPKNSQTYETLSKNSENEKG
jgi:hypothetical protein